MKCPKGQKEQNSAVQDTRKQKRIDADIAGCEGKRSKLKNGSGRMSKIVQGDSLLKKG